LNSKNSEYARSAASLVFQKLLVRNAKGDRLIGTVSDVRAGCWDGACPRRSLAVSDARRRGYWDWGG
jgi:hypothetical protein